MLIRLARKISSFFISKEMIKEEERPIYDYCFEIMLSTLLNLCSVILIAFITKTYFITLLFIVGFMTIRATAGGYHAQTHMACLGILIGSYVAYLIMVLSLSDKALTICTFMFCMVSMLLIIVFSPVEDHNKPLSELEVKEYRRKSHMMMLAISCISIILALCLNDKKWGFSLAAGMFVVSSSLIAGTLKNKRRKIK